MSQTMILVSGDGLGRGDDDLGRRLMVKFFGQLTGLAEKPHVIAFYNAGVKLLRRNSPLVDALAGLEHEGTELILCGTCVEHFGIGADIAIGRVSDMREIVTSMARADKVITV